MKNYIEDERVLVALKDVAANLKGLADLNVPKFPNLAVCAFISTSHWGDKQMEIIVHGVNESDLYKLINFCNSHYFYNTSIFGRGIGFPIATSKLMPYITLCNESRYKSEICDRVVTFYDKPIKTMED